MLRFLLICSLFTSIVCFECKDSGNGYFRDPSDCAKMIRCSNGKITHRFSCSEGKVFNDITKSCEDPKFVNCQNSVTEVTSPLSATTLEPEKLTKEVPIAARLQSLLSTPISLLFDTLTTSSVSTTESDANESISTETIPEISTTTEQIPSDTTLSEESNPEIMTSESTSPQSITTDRNPVLINESFVEYEEIRKPIDLNESFVTYDERIPLNESFVEFDDIKITTTTTTLGTETFEDTDSTTVSTSTPTSIGSDVTPVLESILQNETLMETTVTESTDLLEATTETTAYCAVDESAVGFRMISSNYSTNETSKLKDFYKVVCYFTNWSRYRLDSGRFTVQNINPYLCTHIIYAFAVLDNQTLTMKSSDECTDIKNKFFEQITSLKDKNPRLKVLIALGGWVDSQGDKYSRLVNNQTNRINFIRNAIEFIKTHNFDGLDLDWEYPKCWQSDCSAGPASDKLNFGKLIRELRIAFNKESRPLLLTAAVGATQYIGENAYEFNSLMIDLDFINLMTYDFYTSGSPIAAHHSPLYSHPSAKDLYHSVSNANFSINYWIRKGVPSHKLILGIPFYGRTFKLMNSEINDFGSPANGTGHKGNYTQESGFLAYYEICNNILRNGWAKRVDTYVRKEKPFMTGPYAYYEDQWVGYDDRDHIIQKTEFIKDNGLGGAMVWALDLDDFNGICCKTKSPLLKTINKELREYPFDLKFFCP